MTCSDRLLVDLADWLVTNNDKRPNLRHRTLRDRAIGHLYAHPVAREIYGCPPDENMYGYVRMMQPAQLAVAASKLAEALRAASAKPPNEDPSITRLPAERGHAHGSTQPQETAGS